MPATRSGGCADHRRKRFQELIPLPSLFLLQLQLRHLPNGLRDILPGGPKGLTNQSRLGAEGEKGVRGRKGVTVSFPLLKPNSSGPMGILYLEPMLTCSYIMPIV